MNTEYIKTFEGRIIGSVETLANGDQTIRNFPACQVLGYYLADRNVTTDFYGRVIGQGNILMTLLNK